MSAGFFKSSSRIARIVGLAIALVASGGIPIATVSAGDAGSGILDACELLAPTDLEVLLGGAHYGGTILVELHQGQRSFSQCQYAADRSDRRIGLAILRAPDSKAPESRQDYIDRTRAEDIMGAGQETAAALEMGREVSELGDLALTYDLFSFNLLVWSESYQLTVLLDGFDPDEAEQHAVKVAQSILGQL